jgi:hypothetical protein
MSLTAAPESARKRARVWLVLSLCVFAWACQGKTDERTLRTGPVGTLVGEIVLAPGAQLPAYTPIDLVRRTLRLNDLPEPPSECAEANRAARTPVTQTADGRLRGIVVAASDFTRVRERQPQEHTLHIEHCRLQPSVIAAQGGDVLKIYNGDAYEFEPLTGPAYESRGLPRGKPMEVPLIASGIDAVQCSLSAPCGRTDLLVFHHPVHAISDDTGQFRIENFPAGELVRVTAWHPLFEPTETFVWIEPGQQNSIKLQLTPKARFVVAQP